MRSTWRRGLALTAAAGLFLVGCADEQVTGDPTVDDPTADESADGSGDDEDLADPGEDIEDGVYRGHGVIMPVPDGWSLDQEALAQGVVAATPEDGGAQQLTAQAIDVGAARPSGSEPMEFDTLVEGVRERIGQDAATDEEVELEGAEQAHRLTFRDLPGQQEGQPDNSVTLVLADGGDEVIGEFVYTATAEEYDEDIATLLVENAGFDSDSEPRQLPEPQPFPAPEGDDSDEAPESDGPDEAPEGDGPDDAPEGGG